MTDDRFKALREALAAGPMPGEWRAVRHDWQRGSVSVFAPEFGRRPNGLNVAFIPASNQADSYVNGTYIAAARPNVVSALLDRLDELEAKNAALLAERGALMQTVRVMSDERAALDARPEPVNECLDTDSPRLICKQCATGGQCAMLTAAPPAPQRPVRLTDEQIAQCIVEARVNGPFARAGTTSFRIARAVEAEVLRLNGGGKDE